MAEAREDLWPPELPDPTDPAPVALLKEQAELLVGKTGGEIEGVVRISIENGLVYHTLYFKPTLLGDSLYNVFSIKYPVSRPPSDVYPVVAQGTWEKVGVSIPNEDEFKTWLRSRLSSEEVLATLGLLKKYVREIRSVRASH